MKENESRLSSTNNADTADAVVSSSPPSPPASSGGGGGWLWDTFRSKFDEQRIDRLSQCRVLQEIYVECRRRRRLSSLTDNDSETAVNGEALVEKKKEHRSLEDVPMGIRAVRYFHWRDMEDVDTGCVREEHALWNCRGVALGCGKDCVALRKCLLEYKPESILSQGKTVYRLDRDDAVAAFDGSIACAKLQLNLKSCVAKAATELEERCKISKKT
jgi:hypothetical protein